MPGLKRSFAWWAAGLGAVVVGAALVARPYFTPEARWIRLNGKAERLTAEAKYELAAAAARKALDLAKNSFDAHDERVLTSLKRLARLDAKLGDSTRAQELAEHALDGMDGQILKLWSKRTFDQAMPVANDYVDLAQTVFGPQGVRVAKGLEDIAQLKSKMGNASEAEEAAQRALDIARLATGPDNLVLADGLHTMAEVLTDQHKYAQAEPLCQQALDIRLLALASDDIRLAPSLHLMAFLYQSQFQYAKYPMAEEYYKRALAIREKAFGRNDPSMAATAGMLGRMYSMSARYAEAEPFLEREVALDTAELGPDHPDVYLSLSILAMVQKDLNEYDKAEQSYLRMLEIAKKDQSSQGHARVSENYRVLSELANLQGHLAQADSYRQLQAASQPR